MMARVVSIAVLLLAQGCVTVTLTAQNSVTPVLLGSVHRVHAGEEPSGTNLGPFETKARYDDKHGQSENLADWDVWRAAEGDPRKYILVDEVRCYGWNLIIVAPYPGGVGGHYASQCEASGETLLLPQRAGDRGAEEAR